MCSGRVDLAHILRAFAKGADGVFIGGCRLGECNYATHGNYHALNLVLLGKKILEHIGLNPERLQIEFMSGGEGNLFVEAVDAFTQRVKALGRLGESEGVAASKLGQDLSRVTRLIPYIKIEKHVKLTARLEQASDYETHFTLEEIRRLFAEVVSYYIDPAKCQACMICARNCPVEAIEGGKSLIHVIDPDRCIKCGTCFNVCPSRFAAVTKTVGPVPPPLPVNQRMIRPKGGKGKNAAAERAFS
jgi:F420-non-reducing hydrogenase iron-sulfur subunit